MKKLLSFVLAVALCAPVFAQRGPKLEQSITAGDVKMSLNYTSVPAPTSRSARCRA